MVATAVSSRRFVPVDLDVADVSKLLAVYRLLQDRPLDSAAALDKWLADFSELSAVVDEYGARRYIEKSCHTDDANLEKAYLHYISEVEPAIKPVAFELEKKYLDCPFRSAQADEKFKILGRSWQADVDIFRPENIPLQTQVAMDVTDYDKISGAMTIHFRGQELTLPQAGRVLEEPDRAARQEVWQLMASRRLADRDKIDAIFEKLLKLRGQIATNAGLSDYRAYEWKAKRRFDYTPDDCLRFADAIEKTCVPLVHELDRKRAAQLKLDRLRPCDLSVDPQSRPPLRPFPGDNTKLLIQRTREIFNRLSPELAGDFDSLSTHGNLDLDSRKGKQPGGYQSSLEESLQPFIFMNAAGVQRDVETLLHEGGHAFHFLAARGEPLMFLRSAPMEFCEVASMAMELLGSVHFDTFYDRADAARAQSTMLEGIIRFFPWMATIDCFQHWLYTHPGHDLAARTKYWISLLDRFGSKLDWTGFESVRQSTWQRQLHLFHSPFYYVEYGIAQLGALQLWSKSLTDPKAALAGYRAGLKLGGTRTLPELFAAAGIRFDFTDTTLSPLMKLAGEKMRELDA
jgi:oligoendopeptidase F